MTASTDWFVGSATKSIPDTISGASGGQIQAFGFRGDDQLFALAVCDMTHVAALDISSVNFHINLHPITAVQLVLVASGRTPAPDVHQCTNEERHQLVHIITDCVIDALTFGCPATMRLAPSAIQWRKFDDQPIATLVLHDASHDQQHANHAELIAACGDPVIHLTHLHRHPHWGVHQLTHTLKSAAPAPLRHIAWHKQSTAWVITLNDTSLVIDGSTGDYTIASDPAHHEEA
jgi:hypothetical protein